ncbi:MAG: transposase [Chloroflexi bacterium]|nr:transposase [Chloroflexota bacterium]
MKSIQTKPEIGLKLLQVAVERDSLPFQWLAADELYGDSPAFRDGVALLNKCIGRKLSISQKCQIKHRRMHKTAFMYCHMRFSYQNGCKSTSSLVSNYRVYVCSDVASLLRK